MNILILIVLLVGAIVGLCQGALKQVANFIGVMAGIVLAIALYDKFGHYLAAATGADESFGCIIAFIIIVIVVPVALGLLASLLTKVVEAVHLGCVNRIIGAAIGMVSYGLLMSVAFNIMDFAMSNGGLHPEKLEQRSELFYICKEASQFALPDVIIVTDATEEANGVPPKHGIKGLIEEKVRN